MSSNQLVHNKWHGYNHFTVPLSSYPDSGTDPIASLVSPFRGIFYNIITGNQFGSRVANITLSDPGSGYVNTPTLTVSGNPSLGFEIIIPPVIELGVNTETKTISSVTIVERGRYYGSAVLILRPHPSDTISKTARFTLSAERFPLESNSFDWGFYSNITIANSAYFQLYPRMVNTISNNALNWFRGYQGYTHKVANSGTWETVFNFVSSVSGEEKYNFDGYGWHIALSSATHRLDKPKQVNIRQKVAVPVSLAENVNRTVTWNTTAQSVFYTLTGNYALTATDILNAKKGGKYTMWIAIDYCPDSNMKFFFDKTKYNLTLKKYSDITGKDEYTSTDNVLQLSATSITRIDFVYDGSKMLGRVTHYRTFIDTIEDLYFAGVGLRFTDPGNRARSRSPVYINTSLEGPGKHFDIIRGEMNVFGSPFVENYTKNANFPEGTGIFITSPFINYPDRPSSPVDLRSDFDANSSYYIAGSGIFMRYLGANLQYINFTTNNAQFPAEPILSKYISLTSSFDRVITYLSAGSWLLPQNAKNLVATPDASLLTTTISAAFPQPPYQFNSSNFLSVKQCLSTLEIEIFSGKDRDISSIVINGSNTPITPKIVDGMYQPYNFNNERTGTITLYRIQQDYTIETSFTNQQPITIPNLILSIGTLNGFTITQTSNRITSWGSNTEGVNYRLVQNNTSLAPFLSTYKALRFASFGPTLGSNTSMTSETQLTTLSSLDSKFLRGFATYTVFKVRNFTNNAFIWWLGSFTGTTEQKGYGLVLSASPGDPSKGRLFTASNYQEFGNGLGADTDPNNIDAGKIYVVCTNYNAERSRTRQEVFINGQQSVIQRALSFARFDNNMTNYNLVFGKHPSSNTGYSDVDIYDFIMFDRALSVRDIIKLNNFFISKYDGYKLV
jgi:hypothetical protein